MRRYYLALLSVAAGGCTLYQPMLGTLPAVRKPGDVAAAANWQFPYGGQAMVVASPLPHVLVLAAGGLHAYNAKRDSSNDYVRNRQYEAGLGGYLTVGHTWLSAAVGAGQGRSYRYGRFTSEDLIGSVVVQGFPVSGNKGPRIPVPELLGYYNTRFAQVTARWPAAGQPAKEYGASLRVSQARFTSLVLNDVAQPLASQYYLQVAAVVQQPLWHRLRWQASPAGMWRSPTSAMRRRLGGRRCALWRGWFFVPNPAAASRKLLPQVVTVCEAKPHKNIIFSNLQIAFPIAFHSDGLPDMKKIVQLALGCGLAQLLAGCVVYMPMQCAAPQLTDKKQGEITASSYLNGRYDFAGAYSPVRHLLVRATYSTRSDDSKDSTYYRGHQYDLGVGTYWRLGDKWLAGGLGGFGQAHSTAGFSRPGIFFPSTHYAYDARYNKMFGEAYATFQANEALSFGAAYRVTQVRFTSLTNRNVPVDLRQMTRSEPMVYFRVRLGDGPTEDRPVQLQLAWGTSATFGYNEQDRPSSYSSDVRDLKQSRGYTTVGITLFPHCLFRPAQPASELR